MHQMTIGCVLLLGTVSAALASPASFMPQRNLQADLAEHIRTCAPYGELTTHSYTGDSLWREIEGIRDERCVYTEDLPHGQRLTCRYKLERLPRIADFYANPKDYENPDLSMQSRPVNGEMVTSAVYSRDGEPVDHPLADVVETGECQAGRIPKGSPSRIPAGTIYGEPYGSAPDGFKPHELPFEIQPREVARPEDVSNSFWAVVLRRASSCSIPEDERAELQTFFQQHRVFMNRFGCDDEFGGDEFMSYQGVADEQAFIAIFGGRTREHAQWVAAIPMLQSRYPDLEIVEMKAVIVNP